MNHSLIPFHSIDWSAYPKSEHPGVTGTSYWQTLQYPGLRLRIVEYSPGYRADHWCTLGHIVHCVKGTFTSEMQDGSSFVLTEGMSYIVSDGQSSHRSYTKTGATLLIVDGSFLSSKE
ncbi:MAG: DHCW motif cupin fold protein [Bacteroidota bacterium]|jgi:hypothetical protein